MRSLACDVWVLDVDQVGDVTSRFATADERGRFDIGKHPRDHRRHTGGRSLLRAAVAARMQTQPDHVLVARRCLRCGSRLHGKPTVVGFDGHVSVTHSAALVLVAVTDAAPVGIDVELRQDSIDAEAIGRYMSGPGEDPPTDMAAAVRAWCRKEAVVKATGDGLSVPLRDVPISDMGHVIEPHRGNQVALHDLELDVVYRGYTAAVAVLAAGVVVPRILDGAELLHAQNGDGP